MAKKTDIKKTFLDRAISYFNPERGLRRLRARAAEATLERHYEAATQGRRGDGWNTSGSGPNSAFSGSLTVLRNRARDLGRNNPWANRAVEAIESNVIGTGIIGQPVLMDPEGASEQDKERLKEIRRLWLEWVSNPETFDADGLLCFHGMQSAVMAQVAESGEVLARRRRRRSSSGLTVPLQIQLLEADHIDDSRDNVSGSRRTNFIKEGIEFDGIGGRVAYWLYKNHPGERDIVLTGVDSLRVLARDVAHIFRVDRPGQIRGIPWGAPAMLRLHDLDGFEDAQLLRQKIAACYAVFVHDLDTPSSAEKTSELEELGSLEPGIIEMLPPGKSISFANPPGVDGDYTGYVAQQLRAVAMSYGITVEAMTGDLERVNFSSGRMGRLEMQRNIRRWQNCIMNARFNARVWDWFKEAIELLGVRTEGVGMKWTPPRVEMIDPVKETDALKTQIRAGLVSLPDAIRGQGDDPEKVFNMIEETNAILDEKGLILDSDPRNDSNRAAMQPEEDEEPPVEDEETEDETEDEEERAYYLDEDTGEVFIRAKNGKIEKAT